MAESNVESILNERDRRSPTKCAEKAVRAPIKNGVPDLSLADVFAFEDGEEVDEGGDQDHGAGA
jgi:hypothetical protein